MDFSRILDAWEKRKVGQDQEPPPKDEVPRSPSNLPSRAEMERAPADDELDLHGMVQDEALAALRSFLGAGGRAGYRKVLVIHGKGLHSEKGKAVLKEAVQQALRKDRNVSAWGEAGRKEGGQGASWVWLSARGR